MGKEGRTKTRRKKRRRDAKDNYAQKRNRHINNRHKVDMTNAEMVYKVLYEKASARRSMKELTLKLI